MFEVWVDENSKPIKVIVAGIDITDKVFQNGIKVELNESKCVATMSVNCVVRSVPDESRSS